MNEYWEKFTQLLKCIPMYQKDEKFHIRKLIMDLNVQIGGEVDVHGLATMDFVYEKAIKQEQRLKSISNY